MLKPLFSHYLSFYITGLVKLNQFLPLICFQGSVANKFYVHNDIFRYQDEVFGDSDTEPPEGKQQKFLYGSVGVWLQILSTFYSQTKGNLLAGRSVLNFMCLQVFSLPVVSLQSSKELWHADDYFSGIFCFCYKNSKTYFGSCSQICRL